MDKTCKKCDGKCCKYVCLEIDEPEELEDFENIKWYVAHKNINVFVELDGSWTVEFVTPCENLTKDNKCSIYDSRPAICREYTQDTCPFYNKYEEAHRFECIVDVEKYIEEVFKK